MDLETTISDVCHSAKKCGFYLGNDKVKYYCPQSERRDIKNLDCSHLGDLIENAPFRIYACQSTNGEPQIINYKLEFYELRKIGLFKELYSDKD